MECTAGYVRERAEHEHPPGGPLMNIAETIIDEVKEAGELANRGTSHYESHHY